MQLGHDQTLSGPLQVQKSSHTDNIGSQRITVREVESVEEVVSPQAIQQMFELYFNDRRIGPDESGYSQEGKRFN